MFFITLCDLFFQAALKSKYLAFFQNFSKLYRETSNICLSILLPSLYIVETEKNTYLFHTINAFQHDKNTHTGNAGGLGTSPDELQHQQARAEEESASSARRTELVRQ